MNQAQAAQEAKALVAEWLWAVRRTDDESWRQHYSPADQNRIAAELDRIEEQFEQYGPSRYTRNSQEPTRSHRRRGGQ